MTPRVILDARCVGEHISGIERYVLGLIQGLTEVGASNVAVLGRRTPLLEQALGGGRLELIECDLRPWSVRSQMLLPGVLKRVGADVYHCPYVFAPLRRGKHRTIITVHDMIPHVMRGELKASLKSRFFPLFHRWFAAQCRRAHAIITVSEFSRQELCRMMNVSPAKVRCIYPGVGATRTNITEQPIRQRLHVTGPIVSYIGRHDPYKNIAGLIEAFHRAVSRLPADCMLVIGGKPDARYPIPASLLDQPSLRSRIVMAGYLDEDSRVALLRASSVFVFPSKYEGFGLPPLEAMMEGVPVVSSNATSLPEALGDAAIMVDPTDCDAMAAAICSVIDNRTMAESLRARGQAQAAKFTWRKCAEQHLAAYEL